MKNEITDTNIILTLLSLIVAGFFCIWELGFWGGVAVMVFVFASERVERNERYLHHKHKDL